jgi:SAM-dependent methyltransferase
VVNRVTNLTDNPVDGKHWLERWDLQQEGFMANREERFGVIFDVVRAASGTDHPVVLDLCCGPGSLAVRTLDRFPGATVVAFDNDPVLMLLGRRAYGDRDGRLRWAEGDLRRSDWTAAVAPFGPFDAMVSTTALHWLSSSALAATYRVAADLLARGGVFVNGDHMHEAAQPRLAELQSSLRRLSDDEREGWLPWWDALEDAAVSDRELSEAFALRAERDADHPETSDQPGFQAHVDALRAAGFDEVGTVWQHGDDRVLVAMRSG